MGIVDIGVLRMGLDYRDDDGWRIVRRRMYDELIGHENHWREVLGSGYESVKIAVHCVENQVGATFQEWFTLPGHGIVSSHCDQCGSRQPIAWECLHISTST
ncbi:hypothetical protein Scep_027492 [Stephania cephalantha]|uniref:Uncharacterized protein n=1 Tax=Stephania cephalantha TaxID=152367 RepID=A0AAP0HML1_9MAGN